MSHPDDETVAALATGETVSPAEVEHVVGCPSCAERVAATRHAVTAARSAQPVPAWTAPPSRVWDAIVDQIGADDNLPHDAPEASDGESTHTGVVRTLRRPAHGAPGRRRRLVRWTVGAAAAGLLLGVGGTRVVDRWEQPSSMQVAAVALDTLKTNQRLGEARVVQVDGTMNLRIDTAPLSAERDGYLEVWLINTDLKRMVSVGVLGSGERTASFPISAALLAQGYTIVDISRELYDDKPQHSGDSLVRGRLKV